MAVSLVLWWPSTVSRLSELSMASFKALPSNDLLIAASVVMNSRVVAMLGPIIPAPLTVPAIFTSARPSFSSR